LFQDEFDDECEDAAEDRDPDLAAAADRHEQWLRDNLPPHHT
jgi:hypothetical protein